MTRPDRFLSSSSSTKAADPPEAVAVESDFVVILAALLCALICVVGLIAVARCAWLRRSAAAANSQSASRPSANKGLKKKVVQTLPTYTYGATEKGKSSTECAICLAEYADGDEIRVLPQCGHGFHVACIDTWLGSRSSCPSCRQILVVARCRKCGEYPAVSGVQAPIPTETELKARQDIAGTSFFLP